MNSALKYHHIYEFPVPQIFEFSHSDSWLLTNFQKPTLIASECELFHYSPTIKFNKRFITESWFLWYRRKISNTLRRTNCEMAVAYIMFLYFHKLNNVHLCSSMHCNSFDFSSHNLCIVLLKFVMQHLLKVITLVLILLLFDKQLFYWWKKNSPKYN